MRFAALGELLIVSFFRVQYSHAESCSLLLDPKLALVYALKETTSQGSWRHGLFVVQQATIVLMTLDQRDVQGYEDWVLLALH